MPKTLSPSTPPPAHARIDWTAIARKLRKNPGQWFEYHGNPRAAAPWTIRRGAPRAFAPAGSFDAVLRSGKLYLCYLGDPIEPWDPAGLVTGTQDPRTFEELEREVR